MKKLIILLFVPTLAFSQGKVIEAKDSKNSPNDPRAILVYQTQIQELKKSASMFTGGNEGLYKNTFSAEWAYRAVSDLERKEFFDKVGASMSPELQKQLVADLDGLKPVLTPKIPLFKPNSSSFQYKNSELENLMKNRLTQNVSIQQSGVSSADWTTVNKPNGLPDYRFKDGALVIKDGKADHPFCEVLYFRFNQKYNGSSFEETTISDGTAYLCGCN
jgi:hypothetical protein